MDVGKAEQASSKVCLEKNRLNLTGRSRTSRLPWRGQFSPELVEYLIETVCPDASVLFDPFCGSGTVLFEAAQRGRTGFGSEVNPAAWHLASLASLCSLGPSEQLHLQQVLRDLNESLAATNSSTSAQAIDRVIEAAKDPQRDIPLRLCMSAAVLLGMGNKADIELKDLRKGVSAVESLLADITSYNGTGHCYLADARATPIESKTVEAVITSPPYINVFNYHQNYRPAVELLGWQPLTAAKSEIGANRKYRQNRFLTVIQYCLDMAQVLTEVARVSVVGAPSIFVVGRESNVLGASFKNSALLLKLMASSGVFDIVQSTERVFVNRYGQQIYEDIIVARAYGEEFVDLAFARECALSALIAAEHSVPEKNRDFLIAAQKQVEKVVPSPLFKPL